MPGPAVDVIRQFGNVEDDQRYTRLVELFTDDAVYYDPFLGAQRGREAIRTFMGHMEEAVPASGIRFLDWEVEADTVCGWARWTMSGPGPDGEEVPVAGQSLYRLRDGLVCFAADYVDAVAMERLRPGGPTPDHATAAGLAQEISATTDGPSIELVRRFWAIQDGGDYAQLAPLFTDDATFTDIVAGEFVGGAAIAGFMETMKSEMPARGITFELVDAAADTTVAWSQWTCHHPRGTLPGWTLHTVRDGRFTLDADHFDTVAARAVAG